MSPCAGRGLLAIRICILGEFAPNPDEGMRKAAVRLREELSGKADLIGASPREALRSKSIRDFRPDIILYVPGPSPMSLLVLKTLRLRMPAAKTASMITHPHFVRNQLVWRLLSPDILLTFSPHWKAYLSRFSEGVHQIPGAVDARRFCPVGAEEKVRIRKELGLPEEAFIALHVGHMRKGRGLKKMLGLPAMGVMPVIVASKSTGQDAGFKDALVRGKCMVVDDFVPAIELYYQAADCYVFPTEVAWRGMDLPLSIIEAMACGLPIVSMDFGCISELYGGVQGVRIADSEKKFLEEVALIKNSPQGVETRRAVEVNGWGDLAERILKICEVTLNDVKR
jgi:glycosyltransferase involved in cell wall biosynthesis